MLETTPLGTINPSEKSDIHAWLSERKPGLGGRLLMRLSPFRTDVILSNIRTVFPKLSASETHKLGELFCDHLLRSLRENVTFRFMSDAKLKASIRVVGQEHLFQASAGGQGVLVFTGHFGNFERSPVAAIGHYPEFKGRFHILRRPIANRFIERALFSRYYRAGLDIIPKRDSIHHVFDLLSLNDAIVFVMDQYAKASKEGVDVEFFGKKAGTFRSLALVAKRSGAPVVPSYTYREDDGGHVMEFFPALNWIEDEDADSEIYRNTLAYNQSLETMVSAHPDQWWWPHRRWKNKN